MPRTIRSVAVVGAGTMGASIAALMANAGIPAYLLDIPPSSLTPQEQSQGLTLSDPVVRNRIVNEGFERMRKAKPENLFNEDAAKLIRLGNTEDHFHWVGEADWIIEVIVERLDLKQALMARIEAIRKPDSVVSSNTSGLPIAAIAASRGEEFRAHFLGTHFFNPPRYLKLLEVIPTADTDPKLVADISHFAEEVLGKGVVIANDTPNFIGNRLAFIASAQTIESAISNGYTVSEVDLLTGPLIGRPKTGTFRLADLVGIDVLAHVAGNLYDLLPHDSEREILRAPAFSNVLATMIERNWLGNKTKVGFSKEVRGEGGQKEYWSLNLQTLEHESQPKPRFDSVGKLKDRPMAERLPGLVAAEDRAGEFLWFTLSRTLNYAAAIMPEVSNDPLAVDNAMKWGFQWELGPFEMWDMLGVAETTARMEADGLAVPTWVKEMMNAGGSFYRQQNGRAQRWMVGEGYVDIASDPKSINLKLWKQDKNRVIAGNSSASLVDIGDGVALLEFHAKTPGGREMNAVDPDMFPLFEKAVECVESDFEGLVIGNQGEHFSAGANIFVMLVAAQQQQWDQIDDMGKKLQGLRRILTRCSRPVVSAPFGMTLGGGAEVAMAADRIVAAAETYMGLPEVGLGILPAGGGTKELVRRVISPAARIEHPGIDKYVQHVSLTIATAKIATSAAQAFDLGFLTPCDRIVMNKEHLLAEAKAEVLAMASTGYRPYLPSQNCYAAGRDALATLYVYIDLQRAAGYISDHDVKVARKVAYVVCGGDLSAPQWVDEDYLLDLEREAVLSLFGEPLTQARMWHFLQTNKPLRN